MVSKLDFEQLNSSLLPHHPAIDIEGETLQDKDPNLGKYPTAELQVYRQKKPLLSRVHSQHASDQSQLLRPDPDLHHNPPGKTSDTNLSLPTTSIPKPVKQFRLQNSHSRISKNGLQQLFRLMELKKDGNSGYKRHVDFSSDYKGDMMRI